MTLSYIPLVPPQSTGRQVYRWINIPEGRTERRNDLCYSPSRYSLGATTAPQSLRIAL